MNILIKRTFTLVPILLAIASTYSFAEDVKVTTYYPSPAGVYKTVEILNGDESTTLTDFTQGLIKAGLNVVTDFTANAYTPGLFWSTQNNNATKPKAGIWLLEDTNSTHMIFGTSNDFSIGINSFAIVDEFGHGCFGCAANAAPQGALEVNSTTSGFLPPQIDNANINNIVNPRTGGVPIEGTVIYNTTNRRLEVYRTGVGWVSMGSGFPAPDYDSGTDPNSGHDAAGWVAISSSGAGSTVTLNHNLGTLNYFVYLEGKDDTSPELLRIHDKVSGSSGKDGAYFKEKNTNSIKIQRISTDDKWQKFRARLWRF